MLKAVTRPDGNEVKFIYDALGRRISKSYQGKTTRWVWDGNVILHEWIETQLSKIKKSDSLLPEDSIKIKIRNRDEKLTSEPANAPPSIEASTSEVTTWVFEPGTFSPLGKLNGENQYGIITDHLGTPVSMYNEVGEEVWEMDLSIYGEVRNLKGQGGDCPFRYPGQYEDSETGLYYNSCLLYTSPSPRDATLSRMPSSA